jgi:hypothetical protein
MNKSLTYKKDAKKSFAEGYFNNKFASQPKTVSANEAFVYDIANDKREFFKPIFANETKYLPNVKGTQVLDYSEGLDVVSKSKSQNVSNESLTIPPNKKSDDFLKFIVVGASLFLVYQIISD